MNNRQRFQEIMNFKAPDRYLNCEIGVWEQTIDIWKLQGLPNGLIKNIIMLFEDDYFDLDLLPEFHIEIIKPYPFMNKKIVKSNGRHEIFIDEFGIKRKGLKEGSSRGMSLSMDQILESPVKDRDSFIKWKKKFIGNYNARYPDNLKDKLTEWKKRDYPLFAPGLGQVGFYSFLRQWMGTEGASFLFYDNPKLLEEILDFLTSYFIDIIKEAINMIDLDWFMYWEDMAYKNGPLVSPAMVKKYFVPGYKKINEVLRKNGVNIIFVDSDGDIKELIPLFLDAGINGVLPLEVNGGMDVVKLRKAYGKDLLMIGGINKLELAKGKESIKREINNKILPIIEKGGYIPTVDHLVPPDVKINDFKFYIGMKKRILTGKA